MANVGSGLSVRDAKAAGPFRAMLGHVLGWPLRVYRARRLMRLFSDLADHELRDIGLTRHDVEVARLLPFDADPSAALQRRAEARRRRR